MMRVKVEEIGKGLGPNEVVVALNTTEGRERLVVDRRALEGGSIEIGWPVKAHENVYLIELPRETQSGTWRVWVYQDQLISKQERARA